MLLDNQEVIQFQGLYLGVFSFLIKSATLSRTDHRNIQRLGAHMNGEKRERKKKALTTDSPCLPAFIFISGNLFYQQCNAVDVENSKQPGRGMTIAKSLDTFR